jgi:hypothetical protein
MFLLVFPGATGKGAEVGLIEVGMALVYLSIFLFVFYKSLSKAALVPQGHPFLKETDNH